MADMPEALEVAVPSGMHVLGGIQPRPRSTLGNLSRDVLWQMAGTAAGLVVMLAMNMLAVRLLGRLGFGAFGLVQTMARWCSTVLAFGTPTVLLIYSGTLRRKDKRRLVGLALIALGITASGTSIWICVDPPGPGSLTMPQLSAGIGFLVVLLTVMHSFKIVATNILLGADRIRLANLLSLAYAVSLAAGVVAGGLIGGNYVGALWGASFCLLFMALTVTVIGIACWGIALPPMNLFLSLQASVGLRSYLVRVSETLAETFGILFLSYHQDLYGVAAIVGCQRMAMLLSNPAAVVNSVLKGKVAGQESGEREAKKALQIGRLTFFGAVLLAVPLLLFVRPFVVLTLGPEFSDAGLVMVLYILSATLRGHGVATSGLLVGQGCRWPLVLLKLGILAFTVLGVVILAPRMGAVGVALVQVITSLAHLIAISAILARQSKSVKAVFVGNDLAVLARLPHLRTLAGVLKRS